MEALTVLPFKITRYELTMKIGAFIKTWKDIDETTLNKLMERYGGKITQILSIKEYEKIVDNVFQV